LKRKETGAKKGPLGFHYLMKKLYAKLHKPCRLTTVLAVFLFGGKSSCLAKKNELLLDYSSMDVRQGENNREINGYSELRYLAKHHEKETNHFFENTEDLEISRDDPELVSVIVAEQDPILEMIGRAFEKTKFRFDQPITPETEIPEIELMRYYTVASTFKAQHLINEGNGRLALERMLLVETHLNRFGRSGGGMIHLLTTLACYNIWQQYTLDLVAELNVTTGMLEEAANTTDYYQHIPYMMQSAMRYEFHFSKYLIELTLEKPLWTIEFQALLSGNPKTEDKPGPEAMSELLSQSFNSIFFPVETKNKVFCAYSEAIEEAGKFAYKRSYPIWSEVAEYRGSPENRSPTEHNPVGKILLDILMPAVDAVQKQADLVYFSGAATRVLFALRAFYNDESKLPDTLDELVPTYLKSIPSDPFDGQPIKYSKKSMILYSVGDDFIDSGGSNLPFYYEGRDLENWAERDFSEPTLPIRFLDGESK
jgi:hypothetical protein